MSAAADMDEALRVMTDRFRARLQAIPATARLATEVGYALGSDGRGGAIHMPAAITHLAYGRGPSAQSQGGILKQRIREWILRKGLQPRDNISLDSLAWLIARKIHRQGLPPQPAVYQALMSLHEDIAPLQKPARSLMLEFLSAEIEAFNSSGK